MNDNRIQSRNHGCIVLLGTDESLMTIIFLSDGMSHNAKSIRLYKWTYIAGQSKSFGLDFMSDKF